MIKEYLSYLRDNPEGYWFKRKLYGWGWVPVRWQGWAVVLAFLAFVFLALATLGEKGRTTEYLVSLAVGAAAVIWIGYKKGERPRWQWGGPRTKDDR